MIVLHYDSYTKLCCDEVQQCESLKVWKCESATVWHCKLLYNLGKVRAWIFGRVGYCDIYTELNTYSPSVFDSGILFHSNMW